MRMTIFASTVHRFSVVFLFHAVDEQQQQVRSDTSMGLAAAGNGNNQTE